jgi:hypothetical protein
MTDSPAALDEAVVVKVIQQSAIVGWLHTWLCRYDAAARSSWMGESIGRIRSDWRVVPRPARLAATGVFLITAAAVHLGLLYMQRRTVGWLWVVVPGIVLAQGLMLLAWSRWIDAGRP